MKSSKFITIQPDHTARDEHENLRVVLSHDGNNYSWLQILPKFKIDHEGDKVINNSEVCFKVAERPNEFLHCSDTVSKGKSVGKYEVNCSLESSSWRLKIYENSMEPCLSDTLKASQLIILHDPETRANLTVFSKNEYLKNKGANMTLKGTSSSRGLQHGDVIIEPVVHNVVNHMCTNAVWMIEAQDISHGGALSATVSVRFRHLNTGRYLAVKPVRTLGTMKSFSLQNVEQFGSIRTSFKVAKHYRLTTEVNHSSPNTLFVLSAHLRSQYLTSAKAFQLGHDNYWLHRGEQVKKSSVFLTKLSSDKLSALNLLVSRYVEEDSKKGSILETLDIHVGITATKYLDYYINLTPNLSDPLVIPSVCLAAGTLWPNGNSSELYFFDSFMRKLIQFVRGQLVNSTHDSLLSSTNVESQSYRSSLILKRQHMVREQGCLDQIIILLRKLVPISVAMEKTTTDEHNVVVQSSVNDIVETNLTKAERRMTLASATIEKKLQNALRAVAVAEISTHHVDNSVKNMAQVIITNCLSFLALSMDKNHLNQIYVADYLDVLLAHVGTQPIAAKCVTEMLSNNIELQQTKVGYKEIEIFVDKLRSSPLNPLYLRLLSSCCTCMGKGVDKNQCAIAEELLSKDSGCCVIQIQADYSEAVAKEWDTNVNPIFFPSPSGVQKYGLGHTSKLSVDAENEYRIMGDVLLTKGMPKLNISWTFARRDNSPMFIFGKNSVRVDELYSSHPTLVQSNSRSITRREMAQLDGKDQRERLAEFFTMQMNLFADLCMDRNYVAISKLERMFPYDVLVSILKSIVNDALRAAVLRFLSALYVDREPQNVTPIPCMSRLWSEISVDKDPSIPSVEPSRLYTFALLQTFIASHLNGMKSKPWDNLSLNVVKLLRKLIRFNFYSSIPMLRSVSIPLVRALDRRKALLVRSESSVVNPALVRAPSQFNRRFFQNRKVHGSTADMKAKYLISADSKANLEEETDAGNVDLDDMDDKLDQNIYLTGKGYSRSISEEVRHAEYVKTKWQYYVLQVLESIHCLVILLAIVIASLILQLYVLLADQSDPIYTAFDYAVTTLLGTELCTRFYCHYYVRREFYSFMTNVFNIIDCSVILLDLILIAIDSNTFANSARIIRLIRLVRIFRSAKILNKIVELAGATTEDVVAWVRPERYASTSRIVLDTMLESTLALSEVQNIIIDRNISLFLNGFRLWYSNGCKTDPIISFHDILTKSKEFTICNDDIDLIFIDLMMFEYPPLVQSILTIIMQHYSSTLLFIECSEQLLQIITSSERENQFLRIREMLLKTERYAETYELWGNLKTSQDEDTYEDAINTLRCLTSLCQRKCTELEFGETDRPEAEVQNMLRNLGCFDICFKVLDLFTPSDESFGSSDQYGFHRRHSSVRSYSTDDVTMKIEIKSLMESCINLLYWFIVENTKNQELAFGKLPFFLNILSSNINGHLIIKAIFKENSDLMKSCPNLFIEKSVDNICKLGKRPYFLVLLSSICVTNHNHNIPSNQMEIIKHLIAPGVRAIVLSFFCSIDSSEYAHKVQLMDEAKPVNSLDVSFEDLNFELQYHLELVKTLTAAATGRLQVAIMEAKVQSVFAYRDVVDAMLDEKSLIIVNTYLGLFLYHVYIEVEVQVSGIQYDEKVWSLLKRFPKIFDEAYDALTIAEMEGLDSPKVSRQRIEYMLVCSMIASSFFSRYFDKTTFFLNEHSTVIKKAVFNDLIGSMFSALLKIYQSRFISLSSTHTKALYDTCDILSKVSPVNIQRELLTKAKLRSPTPSIIMNDAANDYATAGYSPLISRKTANNSGTSKLISGANSRNSVKNNVVDLSRAGILDAYRAFCDAISSGKRADDGMNASHMVFARIVERLPIVRDRVHSDVRLEPFLAKLVNHIRGGLEKMDNITRMDPQYVKTSIWVLKMFLSMIENKWGVCVSEYDGSGSVEQDQAAEHITRILNDCGVTALCLDFISVEVEDSLMIECLKLAQALLMKEGGCAYVQETMYQHLTSTKSELFFKEARVMLQKLNRWHSVTSLGRNAAASTEPTVLPYYIMLLRFLQLMCEGHFLKNQDAIRDQPFNESSINLLDDLVVYLSTLSKLSDKLSVKAALQTCATLLDAIQGPCMGNQLHLALNTPLIETLNRLLRAPVADDDEEGYEVKIVCVEIFLGLLEGQGRKSAVYERVLSVIHLDTIQFTSSDSASADYSKNTSSVKIGKVRCSNSQVLQRECEVLIHTLCGYRPSLVTELDAIAGNSSVGSRFTNEKSGISSIELNWRGELQRRFFRIPDICTGLSDHSKAVLVQEVDRSNQENKLFDFVSRCKDLYRELKHEQKLKRWKLNMIFNRSNQNRATWVTFWLACLINLLCLCYYSTEEGEVFIPDDVVVVIEVLNSFQIIFSFYTMVSYLVVRVPVRYESFRAAGNENIHSLFHAITDPMTMYYLAYLVVSFLGSFVSYVFLSLQLLDIIVKNSTARNVLYAVVHPRKQLAMTLILGLFVCYIFAFIIVSKLHET